MIITNITQMTFNQVTEYQAIIEFRKKKDWKVVSEDTQYITFELKKEYYDVPITVIM